MEKNRMLEELNKADEAGKELIDASTSTEAESSGTAENNDAGKVEEITANASFAAVKASLAEEKSYKARVEELLKWQNELADEQAKLESYRTDIFRQMGELEQKKKTAISEQQAALQEERLKFEVDMAAARAKKDAEILAMIESEWSKFEKEKEVQIIELKKELESMRSQTQKEMDALQADSSSKTRSN